MQINKSQLTGYALILMLFPFLFGTSARAQSLQEPRISWGLKGGVSITTMYGNEVVGTDARVGFVGGLFLNYRLSSHWSIQPEVLFSMKGARLDRGLTGEASSVDYRIGYLEVPVLLRYTFTTHSRVKPYVNVGPQVGFVLYSNANGHDLGDSPLHEAEFSIAAGGGFNLDIASSPSDVVQTVGLDLRYVLGLTDVFDVPAKPQARNQAFMAGITVGF